MSENEPRLLGHDAAEWHGKPRYYTPDSVPEGMDLEDYDKLAHIELAPASSRPLPGIVAPSLPETKAVSMVDKVRAFWTIIETVVAELIAAAEVLYGPQTGATKKAYVKAKVLELLRELEGRHDYLPQVVESLTFKVVEWSLDFIIERVFRALSSKGLVNVSA